MPQLLAHRAAVRAAQFAIAAAGILFLLLVFSRQAHAAAGDENPGALRGITSAVSVLVGPAPAGSAGTPAAGGPLASAVTSVASAAGSVVSSAAQPVTGAVAAQAPVTASPAQPSALRPKPAPRTSPRARRRRPPQPRYHPRRPPPAVRLRRARAWWPRPFRR